MYRAPLFVLLVAGSVGVLASCGETERKRPSNWPDGWIMPDAQVILDSKTSDLGTLPDGLKVNPLGPIITFISPTKKQVVTTSTLNVQAKITDKDSTVNVSTVKLTFQGGTTKVTKTMTASTTPDVFEAKLDLTKLTGSGRVIVEASDMKGNKNTAFVEFSYDAGPTIAFTAPAAKSNHKSKVTVQVLVTDTVEIKSFKVQVGATKVPMKQILPGKLQQVWTGSLTFKNFTPPLSGSQVLVAEATNKNGARATKSLPFTVDDKGPTIKVTSQTPGTIIGGVITLSATITDAAGVLESSVKCVIGNGKTLQTVVLKNSTAAATTFTGQFDTRTLLQTFLWPVMSFRATDKLGNEAHEDIVVGLDNGKPIMEFDPPEDFHMSEKKTGYYLCSRPFDPVGVDAADDKQQVPQVTRFRGRFQDQGNDIPSAPWVPFTGINDTSVFMYVLDDTTQALVYDLDGDGYCDAINPEIIPLGSKPTAKEAVAVKMAVIKPTGKADFRPPWFNPATDAGATAPDGGGSSKYLLPSSCKSWGTKAKPPEDLCLGTSMTAVIPYANTGNPAIYTIPPVQPKKTDYTCSGLPFDFLANKISDGWACVAATATDKLGNRGVTPPLRVYVNNSPTFTKPTVNLPAGAGTPPHCPGARPKGTGQVESATPCKFRNPRAGSSPQNGVYLCDTKMKASQMFCHNEVYLAP